MQTGYASIAVDASSSAASAADQSQHDAWRPQHPQRCTAAAQSTPPQPARRKDANSPTSVIDARDDKQFAPLGAAQNHAVARAALLGVALTLGVLLVMLLALGGAYPALVGPGLLALGFGLRHGIDQCCVKHRPLRCRRVDGVEADAVEPRRRRLRPHRRHRQRGPQALRGADSAWNISHRSAASHRRRRRENQREGFWRHWCRSRAGEAAGSFGRPLVLAGPLDGRRAALRGGLDGLGVRAGARSVLCGNQTFTARSC